MSIFDDTVRFCPYHGAELKRFVERAHEVGESVCGYYLQKQIGVDGLGVIYRATKGGNTYRLRLYSDALLLESERVSRLCELLESDTQMSGGAIPVVDFDRTEDGGLYSAHPYIPGYSMRDIIERGEVLRESEVSEILLLLLRAVRDIHSQDVVHGNIALSNIILDGSGRIRIHDAGLWDVIRGDQFEAIRDDHPSFFGDVLELMSPEVVRGDKALICSDVFSCGAAACYLLGISPANRDPAKIVDERLDGVTFSLRAETLRSTISDDFSDLLEASTFGTPGVRFQTTRAFITALLSVHSDLEEDLDALDGTLCDRLLNGAERVSSFFDLRAIASDMPPCQSTEIEDSLHALQLSENRIERTMRGVDSDRTIVERTQFDGLSNLIGEALEQTALTDILERAVTTEMDPVDATPTVELEKSNAQTATIPLSEDLSTALDRELFNIFNNVQKNSLKLDDSFAVDDRDDFDSLLPHPFSHESPETEREISADAPIASDFYQQDASNIDNSKHDEPNANDKDGEPNANDKDGEPNANDKDGEPNANDKDGGAAQNEAESNKNTPPGGVQTECESEQSEAIQKAKAAELAFETDEAAFAERGMQPHKRIGKRDGGSKSDRNDVVSMSESKETARVRRRRRNPKDCAPRNDVVEANTVICAAAERGNLPPFCKLPVMTATSGYLFDDSDDLDEDADWKRVSDGMATMESTKANATTSEDKNSDSNAPPVTRGNDASNDASSSQDGGEGNVFDDVDDDFDNDAKSSESEWFGEDGGEALVVDQNKKGRRYMRIALFAALVLVVICVVIGVSKLRSQGTDDSEAEAAKALMAKLDAFEKLLAEPTCENRKIATSMLSELREANFDQKSMQQCRRNYIQAFEAEAKKIRSSLKKSNDIADPLDISENVENIDKAYATCVAAIGTDDAERDAKAAACAETQERAKQDLKRKAAREALALEPEYEHELAGWNELEGVYRDILKQRRGSDSSFAAELDETIGQIDAYKARLEALEACQSLIASDDLSVKDTQVAMAGTAPSPSAPTPAPQAQAPAAPQAQAPTAPQAQAPTAPQAQAPTAPQAQAEAQKQAEALRRNREQKQVEASNESGTRAQAPKQAQKTAPSAAEAKTAPTDGQLPSEMPPPARPAAVGGRVPTAKLIADANAAMNKRDFSGAVKVLEQAVKQDPRNGRAHFTLAKANERLGKLALAAQNANTACELLKAASCYEYLGDLYTKIGQNAEATKAYQKAK